MDPPRRPRGRARGFSHGPINQQHESGAQQMTGPSRPPMTGPSRPPMTGPSRPPMTGPSRPSMTGPSRPPMTGPSRPPMTRPQNMTTPRQQMSGSRPGGPRVQGPRPLAMPPRPQAPRLVEDRSDSQQIVQQTSHAMKNLTIETPIAIGRGTTRGVIRGTEHINYTPIRPISSTLEDGKHGKAGQPIELIANYFPIKSYTNWSLYQYRVDFSIDEDKIGVRRGLLSAHKEFLGPYLFDGTLLFSSRKYELETTELTSKRNFDDQIVIITVTFTSIIETNDYANIQVFNLLLRNCLRHLNLKLVGRNYFDAEAKVDIPKWKLQLWPGYETTIGMFDNGLLLRAEITTKVMRQDNAMDFFLECYKKSRQDYMIKFKSGIIGSVVLTQYNNETYRIDDVDEASNINSTFQKKDGSRMSYKDYYETRWNLKIKYGNQPMLVSKKKKSLMKKSSDTEDLVYLVPEFCILTGFTDDMRNNFNLMRDLAVHTQVGPEQRIVRYNQFLKRLTSTEKSVDALAQWNLTLGQNLIKVPARILPLETISCNTKSYFPNDAADWTSSVRSLPMFLSAKMGRWLILAPQQNVDEVQTFMYSLKKVADVMHFYLPRPEIIPINANTIHSYMTSLEQVINEKNPAFILCVITSSRSDFYSSIKRKLCIDRAVPSQVVLLNNIKKNNLSVCTKIAIQINCKIGGAPWHVKIPVSDMMIVGFDVCHDKQNKNISYGALVASLNNTHTSYFSCAQPHESGHELSNYFATSITLAVVKYRNINRKLPTSIIIYRDGVGDGQLGHVQKVEVESVKSALKNIYNEQEHSMAFIIVKKRISTKFFTSLSGKSPTNPPPGTVIDSVVTDPSMYDFFLVAQNSRFGTVTPTHYNVLEDTLKNWSPDKMQRLTYKLTHMYYNWSGTVRVPAPCQLAHKLAFLCGQVLRNTPNPALNELLYFL